MTTQSDWYIRLLKDAKKAREQWYLLNDSQIRCQRHPSAQHCPANVLRKEDNSAVDVVRSYNDSISPWILFDAMDFPAPLPLHKEIRKAAIDILDPKPIRFPLEPTSG